ncbi:MAG: SDR family oxidoreductase [Candidatus Sericytochromatia bacterium]|nr:SDR family oxidoreductase [Candidatus Sericytochromatia bacterium]
MKNIVIIGGTKGIGLEIANQLSQDNLYIVSRNSNPNQDYQINFIQTDITKDLLDVSLFPESIDGLVYCPGSINLKPFHRLSEEDFMNDWQINFMGAVKTIQALLPKLKKSENASIVLFSTVAVGVGMPFHASIAAAKGAIEGLTKSLAAEFSPKIRVNCVAPSLTETPLAEKLVNTPEKIEASGKKHPLQRIGKPDDIAQIACFLLSQKSSWMTGQIVHVDGGLSTLKV